MKRPVGLLLILGLWACKSASSSRAPSQDSTRSAALRIGYTNIEAVLSFLPEMQRINQELKSYERSLMAPLEKKQAALQTKYQEFMGLQQKGLLAPVDAEKYQAELMRMGEEIQRQQAQAEQEYLGRKAALLQPLTEKLQKAIDELAAEEGYTYIFNNSNATGVATILHAPQGDDVTRKLLLRLGVPENSLPPEGRP